MKPAITNVDSQYIYKQTEEKEIVAFIKEILEMPYEWYREAFKQNRSKRGTKIMKFFQMPWTPLHSKFRTDICGPVIEERRNYLQSKLENQIKENLYKAKYDEKTRDNDSVDLNYFIVRFYDLVDGDSMLWIGIPYLDRVDKTKTKQKFAYQVCISKSSTPRLYEKIMDNYPRFTY